MSETLSERQLERAAQTYEPSAATQTLERIILGYFIGHSALGGAEHISFQPDLVDTHTLPTIAEISYAADVPAEPEQRRAA